MPTERVKSHCRGSAPASRWVSRWATLVGERDGVLDFASGGGRNHPPLLARGARLAAVDRDAGALAALDPRVECIEADLESGPWVLGARRFAMVVCCNYLFRPRLDLMFALVSRGGALVYETFARGNEAFGRPSNPDYLLRPGELLDAARRNGFEVVAYEHGQQVDPNQAIVQRICALRRADDPGPWPSVG
ncbi:MAG: SAM-dependent methyltransferase [Burkholderiaceae bacterium]|nr:SAM-dependent methyltransferase [Burkholderiaceae bacterium]